MTVPHLTAAERQQLLKDLGVGVAPSPSAIKAELEEEWLRPSRGGTKELGEPYWTM